MCGGLQDMMGQQMDQDSRSVEETKGGDRWNVLNPLQIQKTRDAIDAARTGNPNVKLGGGTFGSILERNRQLQEEMNKL
tara:strand:+ start:131 stop:367 length:237 start_codon:yes stop_codon:yes gene_type:complete